MHFLRYISSAAAAAFLSVAPGAFGAEPSGYYTSCENKGGAELLRALHATIGAHTTIGYDQLYDLYKTSDVYPEDGKIWDMYSTKHWPTGSQRCGNYKNVGDCYNREHSFPKSWFDDAKPMYSDAFHLYPTDGKVNGQRSNYPFGECSGGTNLGTHNGVTALGRCGSSTFAGYSGRVFEPDDQYKGDFARSYFYMAACYNDRISGWNSDMLAGNSYPAYKSWAVELLLKWHRQDPVSKKELDRQEAVYGRQRNRNPFIDHPELAEYIWGDKKIEKWQSGVAVEAKINQPVDGSTLNMGVTAAGIAVTRQLKVLTTSATAPVELTASGMGFSLLSTSLSASAANAGAEVTVRFQPTAIGNYSGTVTVKTGKASSTVSLRGECTGGIPLEDAVDVRSTSFTAKWVYIGDADAQGCYTLYVNDDDGAIEGYPRKVDASAASYTVTDLEPSTEYNYSLSSQNYTSTHIDVRTADVVPSIDFLYDGELYFSTAPGEASEVAELLVSTDNVSTAYTVSVKAPFEISQDHSAWSQSISMEPDENRLYMRLGATEAGSYESPIRAVYGEYVFDDATARGVVSTQTAFCEDFEAPYTGPSPSSYTDKTYQGSACFWRLDDALIGTTSQDPAHSGEQCIRFGKNSGGMAQMEEDRERGIAELTFWARVFGSDADAVLAVEYSTDGGSTWTEAGKVTVSGTVYREYKVRVGASGKVRARLRQLSGKRWLLDDLSLTDNTTGLDEPGAERHLWDAYSRGGMLYVVVTSAEALECAIYGIDGSTLYSGMLDEGCHSFGPLVPGRYYLVSVGDFARVVLIR